MLPVILVLLSGCSCCNELTDVEVRPNAVQVRLKVPSNITMVDVPPFRVRARLVDKCEGILPDVLRDEEGFELPAASQYQLNWSWDSGSGGSFVPTGTLHPHGRYVDVEIAPVPADQLPLTLNLRVDVEGEDVEGFASVELYAAPPTGDIEVPEPVLTVELPTIAGVRYGMQQAGYEFRALVEAGHVPSTSASGTLPDGAAVLRMRKRTDVRDQPGAQTTGLPDVPRTVDARIWLAVPQSSGLPALVEHEVRLADSLFARNRVGVRLGGTQIAFIEEAEVGSGQAMAACDRGLGTGTQTFFRVGPNGVGPDFDDKSLLNIIYVKSVHGDARGFTCDHMPGQVGGLIVIDEEDRSPTDLAHEMGHALSLRAPNGHVSDWPAFEELHRVNVMTDETGKWQRSLDHFTIGQAYWMNLSDDSWVNLQISPGFPVLDCAAGDCASLATGKDHLQ